MQIIDSSTTPDSVLRAQATAKASTPVPEAYVGDADFATRMATLKRLTAEAGWTMPDTIVPEGTALIPYGEEKKRKLQAEINALPDAHTALAMLIAQEKARQAYDAKVSLATLRMDDDGRLFRINNGLTGKKISYTHTGLSQCVQFFGEAIGVPRNFTNGLEFLTPKARAAAFNDLVDQATPKIDPKEIRVMRTILAANGDRTLRAVTSTKHVLDKGDTAAVANMLLSLLPKGAKLRLHQTWDRVDFEVFFPMMDREIRVGDVVLGRAAIRISETKDVAANAFAGLLRALCLNFTTAWFGEESIFSTKHMGDEFLNRLATAFGKAVEKIRPFAEAFGDAYKGGLPAFAPTRPEVMSRVEKAFALPSATIVAALKAWDVDGRQSAGDTLAGAVNALTRASQEETFEQAAATEAAAGQLVYGGWSVLEGGAVKVAQA